MQEPRLARDGGLVAIEAVEADMHRTAAAYRKQSLSPCRLRPDAVCGAEKCHVTAIEPLRIGHQHIAGCLVQELRPDVLEHEVDVVEPPGARAAHRRAQPSRAGGEPGQ